MMNSKKLPLITGLGIFILTLVLFKLVFSGPSLRAKPFVLDSTQKAHYENIFIKDKYNFRDGEKVDFLKFNEEIVILNFWASWCVPCVKKFKDIRKLQNKFENKIKVVGVNSGENLSDKEYKSFKQKHKLKFKSIKDAENNILSKFHLSFLPAVVIYHKGKVIHFSNDQKSFKYKAIESQISKLLK